MYSEIVCTKMNVMLMLVVCGSEPTLVHEEHCALTPNVTRK